MKYLRIFFAYLVCFLIQNAFLNRFDVFGANINLILSMTIVITAGRGTWEGICFGVLFGLLQDICFSPITGVSALMYLITGAVIMILRQNIYNENRIVLLVLTVFFTAVYYAGSCLIWETASGEGVKLLYALRQVPAAALLNYIFVLSGVKQYAVEIK